VPDIGVFELSQPTSKFPAPQTTTNFQVGTVYYADNFNFDADLYHISVNNNYTNEDCTLLGGPSGEQCFVNTGHATYQGLEGEATYAFQGNLEGAMVFVNGSYNYAKSGGLWLQASPFWTAAAGVIYKHNGWKFSLIDKTTGPQYADNFETPGYKIHAYSTVNLSAGYEFSHYEVNVTINNLLNDRSLAAINVADSAYLANQATSLNQVYFQAPLSVMGTIKVHY
jgi:iron complex outermembrane receptor protein